MVPPPPSLHISHSKSLPKIDVSVPPESSNGVLVASEALDLLMSQSDLVEV